MKNPNYPSVCTGLTGHAEAVEVEYDPRLVTYEELVRAFFKLHNPTAGSFPGGQYRSAIFTHSPEQTEKAKAVKARVEKELGKKVHTEIKEASTFYRAEEYHQDYLKKHGMAPTCSR